MSEKITFGLYLNFKRAGEEDARRGQRLTQQDYKTLTGAMAGKRALRRTGFMGWIGIWGIK